MEAIPEGFVSIQIHMPPDVLEHLQTAAHRAGLSIEEWLTQLLGRSVGLHLTGRPV
jgi:hypothetical protein